MESPKPVVLKIEGGLGNQLFELAAGYYLAGKLATDLRVDQFSIPLTTVHGEAEYGFMPFNFGPLPNNKEVLVLDTLPHKFLISLAKRSSFIKKILVKTRMYTSNPYQLELFLEKNKLESVEDFFKLESAVKLHGNFQTWRIVEKATSYGFPRVFTLNNKPTWIIEFEKEINFKDSVVLHFRVGDDTRKNTSFKQPELSYYLNALQILREEREVSEVFILSDDIPRVKEMFGDALDSSFRYLEMPYDSSPAERLFVLSLFGGIVCANSTFCGWAAWSIYNSGGNVIVPIPYSDGDVLGSRDFPTKWIQLDKHSGARKFENSRYDWNERN